MKKSSEITSTLNHFYKNPIAKVSLELFLTVGLVLFLAIFAIKPTVLTMSELIKEIENKQKLEKQLTQKIAALQTAQAEYLSIEAMLPMLDEAIPSSPEIIKSAKIIEKVAADNKVLIKSMSIFELPQNTGENIPFSQKSKQNLTFSLSISGDYISIRNFAETLRNSRKSYVIESVTFELEEEKGNKKLNANITINIPYFGVDTAEAKEPNS
ncbi:hypothetical protein KA111_02150 [Candidatus Woesebacteria bacterium]|nr:hypothetical protein [Candidatus Woesebacteria bacterium]